MPTKNVEADFDIGAKLRQARRQQKLSLRRLAARAEVSASLLSQIENGKANPSVRSLYSIADALSLSVDYFFPQSDEEGKTGPGDVVAAADMTASELRLVQAAGEANIAEMSVDSGDRVSGPVLKAEERLRIDLQGNVTWERLTSNPEEGIEFLQICYEPGASSGDKMSRHSGREFGLILEGELSLELGFEQHRLGPGDSIIFESETPHRLSNQGTTPVTAVWVVRDYI